MPPITSNQSRGREVLDNIHKTDGAIFGFYIKEEGDY
jgi:hypothetical protein